MNTAPLRHTAPYSRPLGFAEMVRRHGDDWLYEGLCYASAIHDDRLKKAYLSAKQPNTQDWRDGFKMRCYTERIYSAPINDVRGAA